MDTKNKESVRIQQLIWGNNPLYAGINIKSREC